MRCALCTSIVEVHWTHPYQGMTQFIIDPACMVGNMAVLGLQGKAGFVGADGKLYPPRWQIGEQAVGAAQKLL